MKLRAVLALVALAIGVGVAAPAAPATAAPTSRTVTVVNDLGQTVWMAAAQETAKPALTRTGWKLKAGATLSFTIPAHWNGRIWARTDCVFTHGKGHCATGDCDGRFQCQGFGGIPASLAEFNLDAYKGLDFYDVSLVDGSNVPMFINLVHGKTTDPLSKNGCSAAGCTTAVACPARLRVAAGTACESPCAKLGGARYCCAGKYAVGCSPAKTWPIDYARVFKRAEPFAYSWSGDDATSTFTCTGNCDYRITLGTTAAVRAARR